MSWAKGVEDVQGNDRSSFLPFGTHDVEIVYGRNITKRNGEGQFIKAKCRILASNVPGIKAEDMFDMGINVETHNKDNWKMQIADVKSVVTAAFACKDDEVGEAELLSAFPEKDWETDSSLKGEKIRVVAVDVYGTGKFTKYNCSPFDEAKHAQLKSATKAA